MRRLTDAEISAALVQLRIANGGSAEICPTCCCPRDTPYRSRSGGGSRIVEGCIDASHTADLSERAPSDDDRLWHEREEAQALRAKELLRMKRIEDDLQAWERRLDERV